MERRGRASGSGQEEARSAGADPQGAVRRSRGAPGPRLREGSGGRHSAVVANRHQDQMKQLASRQIRKMKKFNNQCWEYLAEGAEPFCQVLLDSFAPVHEIEEREEDALRDKIEAQRRQRLLHQKRAEKARRRAEEEAAAKKAEIERKKSEARSSSVAPGSIGRAG